MKLFLASTVSLSLGLSMPFASARLDGPGPQPRYEYCDHAASLPTRPAVGATRGTALDGAPCDTHIMSNPVNARLAASPQHAHPILLLQCFPASSTSAACLRAMRALSAKGCADGPTPVIRLPIA